VIIKAVFEAKGLTIFLVFVCEIRHYASNLECGCSIENISVSESGSILGYSFWLLFSGWVFLGLLCLLFSAVRCVSLGFTGCVLVCFFVLGFVWVAGCVDKSLKKSFSVLICRVFRCLGACFRVLLRFFSIPPLYIVSTIVWQKLCWYRRLLEGCLCG